MVFPPGAAAISSMFSPSFGSKTIGGNIDDKLCKYILPSSYIGIFLISFSFTFFIINASLYHSISLYSIFEFFSSFFISSLVAFIVFARKVTYLCFEYPSIILFAISSPYCSINIVFKNSGICFSIFNYFPSTSILTYIVPHFNL